MSSCKKSLKKGLQRRSLFFFFYKISIQLDLNCGSCSISANLISCQSSSASFFVLLLWFVRVALLSHPAAGSSSTALKATLLCSSTPAALHLIDASRYAYIPTCTAAAQPPQAPRNGVKLFRLVVDVDAAVEADVRLKAAANTQVA